MSGTPFSTGQLGKLQNIVNIGIATALPKVAKRFEPKSTLKALEGKGEVFAGRIEGALEKAITSMLVLRRIGTATVVLDGPHDPDSYHRTREGLWVYGDYRSRIVAEAKPTPAGTTFKVDIAEIGQEGGATDEEIEDALPKNHLFGESQVCAVIAGLIAKQPRGEEGDLDNRGYANLFYTSSCVVNVDWGAVRREWNVITWNRDDSRWGAGVRVLSPAN